MSPKDPDLRFHPMAQLLLRLGLLRSKRAIRLVTKFEGGAHTSGTLRAILRQHGIEAGAYSYGSLLKPGEGMSDPGLVVGRYVSIASNVRWPVNHPYTRVSNHHSISDRLPAGSLKIGHDAWIGANVVITRSCKEIGIGAIVGANAVVTRSVPDFAIAAGVPAKIIGFRFPEEVRSAILDSRWWELSPSDAKSAIAKIDLKLADAEKPVSQ